MPTGRVIPLNVLKRAPNWRINARFDNAQPGGLNGGHWGAVDGLSADAAASPSVRKTLRERGRYEVANNSMLRGVVETIVGDTIGTGPRLQVLTESRDFNRAEEADFRTWALASRFAEKLSVCKRGLLQDGEGFGVHITNPGIRHDVKLDLRLIESDRITTPDLLLPRANHVDGIVFDAYGNPKTYHVLKSHPGGLLPFSSLEKTDVPAASVMHWFRRERAGQHRGLPHVMPALGLFAQLRRFTIATLAAAELAANFAGIFYTDAPPDDSEDGEDAGTGVTLDAFDQVEIAPGVIMALPELWKFMQMKAEHPNVTYPEFKREILTEAFRCILVPRNIAAGDSSDYNFASGRLDHITYQTAIRNKRFDCEQVMVEPTYRAFRRERHLLSGGPLEVPHQWMWPELPEGDMLKAAKAQDIRFKNRTTTLADEWGRRGHDWEEKLRQIAKEEALMKELGLTVEKAMPKPQPKSADKPEPEDEDDDDAQATEED